MISFPGRAASQERAKLLARHGYGVLLFDRRGEGESDGDPNLFGWQGERDVHAAVEFLQGRPDVDPERIGAIGLSVGGEMLIEAAAESDALKAIVSEGASGRSVRDIVANPGNQWQEVIGNSVATVGDRGLHGQCPAVRPEEPRPRDRRSHLLRLRRAWPAGREAGQRRLLRGRARPEGIWEVPGSGHMGGTKAQPREYERRVVGFFDRALLGGH